MEQTSYSGWKVRFLEHVGLRRCATVFALAAAFAACSGGGDSPVAEPIPADIQKAANEGGLTAYYFQGTQQLTLTWRDPFANPTFVVETLVTDTWEEVGRFRTGYGAATTSWVGTAAPGTAVRVQALVDRWKFPIATVAGRSQIDLPQTYSIVFDSPPPLAGTVRLSLAGGPATRVGYGSNPGASYSFGNYPDAVAVTWATLVVKNGVYRLSAEAIVNDDLTIVVDHPPVEVRNPPLTLVDISIPRFLTDAATVDVGLMAASAYGIETVSMWIDGQPFAGLPSERSSCGVTYRGICQVPHTYVFVVPGALLPDGNHAFRFVVTGKRGDTAELEKVIAIDKPPLLTLVSPLDNAVLGNSLHIQGSSIDDGGPSEVEISIDNQFIRRIPGGAFDLTLDISALQPGSHELRLQANDVGDHRSWVTIRFTK